MDRPTLAAAGAVSVVLVWALLRLLSKRICALPPGPPKSLLFGNALQIPKSQPWLKFTQWKVQYGDIVLAKVFTRNLVIINSYDLATGMFESVRYADRPRRHMAELSGFDKTLIFMPYGDGVKKCRKIIRAGLNPRTMEEYQVTHTKEARNFAKRILENPAGFRGHIYDVISCSLLRFTYGDGIGKGVDELVARAREIADLTGELTSPNKFAVDIFPFLNSIPEGVPGTGFKQAARKYRENLENFISEPFTRLRTKMMNGTAEPCFTVDLLDQKIDSMTVEDMEDLKWVSGTIHGVGQGSTGSLIESFFLAMVRNPEIQAKAQEELDRVLGPSVLPTFADRQQLPYVESLIKEIYRWHPPVPLSSRACREDDIVQGFVIPAKSFVLANIWAIAHDENVYPDAHSFKPERYLTVDKEKTPPMDPRLFVFGFGRRRCPGVELVDNFLYIMISTTLALFNISPETDVKGRPIIPPEDYTTSLVSQPVPFECRITPRSSESVKMVAWANDGE